MNNLDNTEAKPASEPLVVSHDSPELTEFHAHAQAIADISAKMGWPTIVASFAPVIGSDGKRSASAVCICNASGSKLAETLVPLKMAGVMMSIPFATMVRSSAEIKGVLDLDQN